jgi:hypothetical protein
MNTLDTGDLKINVDNRAEALIAQWNGKSTDRQPQRFLEPFFAALLDEASERKLPIEMHFDRLAHFNSSTIGCLIRLVQDSRTRDVKLVLVYDDKVSWQRLSFDALRVFTKTNPLFELKQVGS